MSRGYTPNRHGGSYRAWSEGPFHSELNPEGNDVVKMLVDTFEDPPQRAGGASPQPLKVFWDRTCLSDGEGLRLSFLSAARPQPSGTVGTVPFPLE